MIPTLTADRAAQVGSQGLRARRLCSKAWYHAVAVASAILILRLVPGPSLAAADFKAGAAMRIVTPDPLLPVSGGVGPSHATTRKLGDLTVRALVLDDGTTRIAIVGADFLGFPS